MRQARNLRKTCPVVGPCALKKTCDKKVLHTLSFQYNFLETCSIKIDYAC